MNSTRHTGGVPFFSHYSYLFCSFDEGLFTLYEKVPLLLLALNSFEKGAMSNQVIASFSKPRRNLQSKELDIFRMYTTKKHFEIYGVYFLGIYPHRGSANTTVYNQ